MPTTDAPDHEAGEGIRYNSDLFAYLDAPETASRYRPMLEWLSRWFSGAEFDLLDVGCQYAQIRGLVPDTCSYIGIDYSPQAIGRCLNLYPSDEFHCVDVLEAATIFGAAGRRFDVVVLNDVIDLLVARGVPETRRDRLTIASCLNRIVMPGGFIAVVVCVPYWDQTDFGLFAQAGFRHQRIIDAVRGLRLELVDLTLTAQLNLEKRIVRQRQRPGWFVERPEDASPNRYNGTSIASLTALFQAPSTVGRDQRPG